MPLTVFVVSVKFKNLQAESKAVFTRIHEVEEYVKEALTTSPAKLERIVIAPKEVE